MAAPLCTVAQTRGLPRSDDSRAALAFGSQDLPELAALRARAEAPAGRYPATAAFLRLAAALLKAGSADAAVKAPAPRRPPPSVLQRLPAPAGADGSVKQGRRRSGFGALGWPAGVWLP